MGEHSMDIKKLRCFVMVAEELNISSAAKKLFIDQSSVSRAIRGLEQSLDVNLFERHPIRLTKEGANFLNEVKKILHTIDHIEYCLKKTSNQKVINVAISPCTNIFKISELLRKYKEKFSTNINIIEASYEEIIFGLKQQCYDFAFSFSCSTCVY